MRGGCRIGSEVGAILDLGRRLRRQEVVLEFEKLRHAARKVARFRIDRDTHQVVAGAVDQEAVLVGLEIAASRIEIAAVEGRTAVGEGRGLLHDEEAVAIDCHKRADRGRLEVALHRVGGASRRGDRAGQLLRGRIVRDEIEEARVLSLESGGLRVRDVAGDVFERERLCTKSRHRGGESAEDTHDLPPSDRRRADARTFGRGRRKARAMRFLSADQ